tara:strand:- start:4571 stop:5056 length:486 start_codon:yes stop_codon:yes gene_type:complete
MNLWERQNPYIYPAKLNNGLARGKQGLESVYDGDTVSKMILDLGFNRYMVTSVRLLGIDTPELRGGSKTKIEKIKGYQARDMLRLIISDNDLLFESVDRKGTGKYGRALGNLWVATGVNLDDDGKIIGKKWENVGTKLIECGLAVAYDGGTKTKDWSKDER